MITFFGKRIGQGAISVLGITALIFLLSRATGNPLDLLLPLDASEETRQAVAVDLGLDRSLLEQFTTFIGALVQGDLGMSLRYRAPVWDLFVETFPMTLALVGPAFVLAAVIGIPLGVWAATSPSKLLRSAISVFGLVGLAIPTFCLGILLILIFSVWLGWLPASRTGTIWHHIMPTLTLSLFLIASLMRIVRSSMTDAMGADYVKLARIKGMSNRRIIWKHALRNSMTTAVSFLGVFIGVLIMGSVVVETVFAWPGSGRLMYTSIIARDYPVIQALVFLNCSFIILIGIAVDLLQAALDPRVRA